jgi:hypothetical protein
MSRLFWGFMGVFYEKFLAFLQKPCYTDTVPEGSSSGCSDIPAGSCGKSK